MKAYYNEFDPFAAEWLRNLIAAGHLPPGDVDERSIIDVKADDLRGYGQVHFFAGIGGWAHALHLAGWRDRPVWTGSCPCQPFSLAGRQAGVADERHLWPVWFDLIRECRPDVVLGEQVASAVGHGWLDVIYADMEGENYACGAVVLGAHSVGAPHIRQRLFFVADSVGAGLERHTGDAPDRDQSRRVAAGQNRPAEQESLSCLWTDCDWLPCTDGKARPVEPGTFPLANGIPNRVGRTRAYGNAIVPQVAATFIAAYMEVGG